MSIISENTPKYNWDTECMLNALAHEIPGTWAAKEHMRSRILAYYDPAVLILVLSGKIPVDERYFWDTLTEVRAQIYDKYGTDPIEVNQKAREASL